MKKRIFDISAAALLLFNVIYCVILCVNSTDKVGVVACICLLSVLTKVGLYTDIRYFITLKELKSNGKYYKYRFVCHIICCSVTAFCVFLYILDLCLSSWNGYFWFVDLYFFLFLILLFQMFVVRLIYFVVLLVHTAIHKRKLKN